MLITALMLMVGTAANAQVNLTVLSFNQTFDTPVLPAYTGGGGLTWANNSTIAGYYAYNYNSSTLVTTAVTEITADDGGKNAKGLYSYGQTGNSVANSSTERALGVLTQGATDAARIGIQFRNTTTQDITGITFQYRGEQWRKGGTVTAAPFPVLTFGYKYTGAVATDQTNATGYSGVSSLNFTAPTLTGNTRNLDGNLAANSATLNGQITGLNWKVGEYLWVKFEDANQGGSDQGFAIDSLSATFQPVPAPPAAVSVGIGALVGLMGTGVGKLRARRRRMKKSTISNK